MATQIAYGNGNFTDASATWKLAETGTGALALIRNSQASLAANSNISSPTFTVGNGDVIEGVVLWVAANLAGSGGGPPAGTLTVELDKSGVLQASVTVNITDLPVFAQNVPPIGRPYPPVPGFVHAFSALAPVPIFFRFTGTATGDGTANWTLKLTTSNTVGAGIAYWRNSGTAGDFTRALRTSTTSAIAAGDDFYAVGELTGAGTHTSRSLTMDNANTNAYGSAAVNSTTVSGGGGRVSCYCSLTYGVAASTVYTLRMAGDLEIFWQGTVTGNLASRSSNNILEFLLTATGQFGLLLRNGGTFNYNGLSRTAGKNVVKTKLNADVVSPNVGTFTADTNGSNAAATTTPDPCTCVNTIQAFTDNTTSGYHAAYMTDSSSRTNVVQSGVTFLSRGSGTRNRFVRLQFGNVGNAALTNGFQADVDLQLGTISACTAVGNGVAVSATLTPCGNGFVGIIVGRASTGAQTPQFGIVACSALGTPVYAGAGDICFNWANQSMIMGTYTDTSVPVADDTGWLAGDAACVASTSRTWNDCSDFVLDANASSSALSTAQPPFGAGGPTSSQSGTWGGNPAFPFIAEVGLLTHYCKIRSTNPSFYAYFYVEPLGVYNISWTEFYYLGSNASTKYGITHIDAYDYSAFQSAGGFQYTTGAAAKTASYCSFHDMYIGCQLQSSSFHHFNISYTQCVFYNQSSTVAVNIGANFFGLLNASSQAPHQNTSTTPFIYNVQDTLNFDNMLAMRGPNAYGLWTFNVVITNSAGVSVSGQAFYYTTNQSTGGGFAPDLFGQMKNLTAHSCNYACYFNGGQPSWGAKMDGFTGWRTAQNGVWMNSGWTELVWYNLTLFGCVSPNMQTQNYKYIRIIGGTLCGDTTFAVSQNIGLFNAATMPVEIELYNVDFSGTGAGMAPSTSADIYGFAPSTYYQDLRCIFNKVKWGVAASNLRYPRNINWQYSFYAHQDYNGVVGDHRYETSIGQIQTDSVIYHTASPSMRMTPWQPLFNSAEGGGVPTGGGGNWPYYARFDQKLTSAGSYYHGGRWGSKGLLVSCKNGQSVNVAANVRLALCSDSPGTTWNPSDRSSTNAFLSNNNLTVKSNQLPQLAVRGTGPGRTSGLVYNEFTFGSNVNSTILGVGITQEGNFGYPISLGAQTQAALSLYSFILFGSTGQIWLNGVNTGATALGSFASAIVGMAIDYTHKTGWFRIGTGNWNGNASANPATNTGGIDLTSILGGPMYQFWTGNINDNTNNSCTINNGQSAFTNGPPSGFSSWDSGQLLYLGALPRLIQKANPGMGQPQDVVLATYPNNTPGTWQSLAGTSSVATDDGAWEFVIDCDASWQAPYGFINVDEFVPT